MPAVIKLRPSRVSVTRPGGTSRSGASPAAFPTLASGSCFSCLPECEIGGMEVISRGSRRSRVRGRHLSGTRSGAARAHDRHRPPVRVSSSSCNSTLSSGLGSECVGSVEREERPDSGLEVQIAITVRRFAFPDSCRPDPAAVGPRPITILESGKRCLERLRGRA